MIYLSPQYDRSDIEIFTTFGVEIDGFFLPHILVVRLMIFLTTFPCGEIDNLLPHITLVILIAVTLNL